MTKHFSPKTQLNSRKKLKEWLTTCQEVILMCGFSKHLCPFKLNFLQTETWQHHLLLHWSHYDFTALHNFRKKYLIIRLPFIYVLKSVLSEITVRTWVQVVFRQKKRPLICWPIMVFWQETPWTHFLTPISEKTDFRLK